ncbi:hypothetical protein AVEN_142066-1 [Araneus ventricosus]|uniref:Uncharacterized protein n=1 Tax=Araneus ventricosus TaxID=182803 RepID=A0A4Y1ZM45_ARAVE|nr:hypothetical protein AVEN_142066-1 [Araneus ventricosus]
MNNFSRRITIKYDSKMVRSLPHSVITWCSYMLARTIAEPILTCLLFSAVKALVNKILTDTGGDNARISASTMPVKYSKSLTNRQVRETPISGYLKSPAS